MFTIAYNAPGVMAYGPEYRTANALDAVLAEVQTRIEGIRLTEEEAAFIERMWETSVDQGFAGSVAVIMSRLECEEIAPLDEGKHRA